MIRQQSFAVIIGIHMTCKGSSVALVPAKGSMILSLHDFYRFQEDDVVACILLLYNPVTRCPVHVHGYRCDSVETASLLTQQLTTLIERPDNQKKLNEIEGRLRAKGLLLPTVPRVNIPKRLNSSGSDGRSTTSPASESSGGSSGGRSRIKERKILPSSGQAVMTAGKCYLLPILGQCRY